jgi:hypothetical protein
MMSQLLSSTQVRSKRRRRLAGIAAAGLGAALAVAVSAGPASAAGNPACPTAASSTATSCTYAYTGAEQDFTVPAGVTAVTITAVGAPGGASSLVESPGGYGAAVTATVPVPAGTTTLYAEVGEPDGPFNGGGSALTFSGNGGGASDVRTCSMSTCALASDDTRLVVAGGGGGGGSFSCLVGGGQAGEPSVTGPGAGGPGDACPAGPGGNSGFGGTAGGPGGASPVPGCGSQPGALGQGGSTPSGPCESPRITNGGGGGGGFYGGGAGGDGFNNSGGGGAGSSHWLPGAAGTSMTTDATGTPQITLSWTTVPPCPAGTKANFRWHYSANGSAGGWSATTTQACPGSFSMGPQAMEGNLQVTPGTTLQAGYDFTLPGNHSSLTITVSSAQVSFAVTCVSGATPSASTFTVTMPTQSYPVTNDQWYPSGDQSSPLVYQGSVTVPNLCGGGTLDLAQGGTFTATLS